MAEWIRTTAAVLGATAVVLAILWRGYWWQSADGKCLPWQSIHAVPCVVTVPCPPEFGAGQVCEHGALRPPQSNVARFVEHYILGKD